MRRESSVSDPSASDAVRAVRAVRDRRAALLAIVAACAAYHGGAGVASAQEPEPRSDAKSACLQAYETSQVLRQQERLIEAREALVNCSREECPSLVRADCGNWLGDVEKALPSVIVQATIDGVETSDVRVTIDGKVVSERLDGKAIPTDPGTHQFRYETPGLPPSEATVVVREGEHYRALPVAFQAPHPPPPPVLLTRPVPTLVWVAGGVAAAGAAGFAVFGILGNQKKQSLQRSCSPFCAPSDVDVVQHEYQVADLSLLVGVAALAVGSVLYLTRPEVPVPVRVGVVPSADGALVSAAGRF
jgi:hypothetical protein